MNFKFFGKKIGLKNFDLGTKNILTTKIAIFPHYISNKFYKDNKLKIEIAAIFNLNNNKKYLTEYFSKQNLFVLKKKTIIVITDKDKEKVLLNNFINKKLNFQTIFKILQNKVNIKSITIGKGFSGNIKRNRFKQGPKTHGSKSHRRPGSIGSGTNPGRVFPFKKMAGHLGNKKNTTKNLKIFSIEKNIIYVQGTFAGKNKSICEINTNLN